MTLPPHLRPPYVKPPQWRMWVDNTGEEATLNADAANGNPERYANMRN